MTNILTFYHRHLGLSSRKENNEKKAKDNLPIELAASIKENPADFMGYKTFFTKTFNHLVIEDGRVDARDRLKE